MYYENLHKKKKNVTHFTFFARNGRFAKEVFNSSMKDRYNLPRNLLINCDTCLQAGGPHFATFVNREMLMCGGNTILIFQVDAGFLYDRAGKASLPWILFILLIYCEGIVKSSVCPGQYLIKNSFLNIQFSLTALSSSDSVMRIPRHPA